MGNNHKIEKGLGASTDPELISEIAREMNISTIEAKTFINIFIDKVCMCLKNNRVVNIRRLGRFYLTRRKKMKFITFQGKKVEIPVLLSVKFRPSHSIRSVVNQEVASFKSRTISNEKLS